MGGVEGETWEGQRGGQEECEGLKEGGRGRLGGVE